jgi:hypothetical protein
VTGTATVEAAAGTFDTAPWLSVVASTGLDGSTAALSDTPLSDQSFAHVLDEVVAHGLQGLLAEAIKERRVPVTERQASHAANVHRSAMANALSIELLLLNVLRSFGAAGVPCRVFKGTASAHLMYPDPSLRVYRDLDLLVPADHFDRAAGVLEDSGLSRLWPELRPGFDRRFGKGTDFRSANGLGVDLHRTFAHGYFGQRIVAADLFATLATFPLAGVTVPALDTENQFLAACYNAAVGGGEPRLSTLRDVAQICLSSSADVAVVLERARTWGGEAVMARALLLTWDRLGLSATSPMYSWAAGYRPSAADRRRLDLYSRADWTWGRIALGGLSAISGIRMKGAYVAALLAPSEELLSHRHQRLASRWWYGAKLLARRGRRP